MPVPDPITGAESPPEPDPREEPAHSEESAKSTAAERIARVGIARSLAEKQWEAEQENARRLATRSNGILTTVAALSGLGFFKIGSLGVIQPSWVSWLVRVTITLSVICTAIGVVFVLDLRPPQSPPEEPWWRLRRRLLRWVRNRAADDGLPDVGGSIPRTPFSSSYLLSSAAQGTGESVESPDLLRIGQHDLERIAYYRLAQAAVDLHVRNIERRAVLMLGQHWLFNGACLAFLGILVYILFACGSPGG